MNTSKDNDHSLNSKILVSIFVIYSYINSNREKEGESNETNCNANTLYSEPICTG
jgi:hypothetical protein